MDWFLDALAAPVAGLIAYIDGDSARQPHNHALLIMAMFAGSVAFWHLVLWRAMHGNRRFWRAIDYVWYVGAFLSLILGAYQGERDTLVTRLQNMERLAEVELSRQDSIMLALVTECDRLISADNLGHSAVSRLFDLPLCRAAQPVLPQAKRYVFEHISGVGSLFFAETKMARLTEICGVARSAYHTAEAAAESDARVPEAELYTLLYCDDEPAMVARFDEVRRISAEQEISARSPFGAVAHLWPLLLSLVVGLRITKTTAEIRQTGRRI
ncbi:MULTISPECIES: hypothetical protein [Thalassobaculum]|uniref:Uncharacterized protein n=1 Tax=Thalassobaculum litoreum DSM 18839 TaxID=1123362 RepID=A0A8G2BJ82_9PROT|nr:MULTISPECIES: hypothetical protein [Thalassobaculum]SDG01892.1 hypothetical protein SAMN05660686_03060 [Thalassobaculum litoreum DSM 18839]